MPPGNGCDTGRTAVLCAYNPALDSDWLDLFLTSLRASGYTGDVHCVGLFSRRERDRIVQLRCHVHRQTDLPAGLDWENAAHIHMSRLLDRIATDPDTRPTYVLLSSTVRAGFLRAPCRDVVKGVSLFTEGPVAIGGSEHNVQWLREFLPTPELLLEKPIISSSLLQGKVEAVRCFYKLLFSEFVDRVGLLLVPKVIQGAFNKLCYTAAVDFPITVHANGDPVYFEIWPCCHDIDLQPQIKVGGIVPSVVVSPLRPSELISALRSRLAVHLT
jgi:hypothetical protein